MRFRLLQPNEAGKCEWALSPALQMSPRIRAAVPAIWRRLVRAGEFHAGAVVDEDTNGRETIFACGMTVFLDDQFVVEYLKSPRPYLAALVYECLADGRSPVVRLRDLAAANTASRLNLLNIHFGTRPGIAIDGERGRTILATVQAGFRVTHVGYRIKRVFAEAYGPEVPFYQAGGFLLKSDFASFYAKRARPPAERHPYLMGLFDEDPESRVTGTNMSYLFQRVDPRFHFSPAEQRMLQRALLDESDAEIAAALCVSPDAVKKTWARVHQRIAATAPNVHGEASPAAGRGKERRRRLLQYLRYHLEELRPFANGRGASSVSD
jgi:DNA-binding CsgD family transcriptional regulator